MIGDTVRYDGRKYTVIEVLETHLLVIPVNGVFPANPLVIPKEPEDNGD